IFLAVLVITYLLLWMWSSNLNRININVEGSDVIIKAGDIFDQRGFKAIAFNEYFDTAVDNQLISDASLNGVFITNYLDIPVAELDSYIDRYDFSQDEILDDHVGRTGGKRRRYKVG